MMKSFDLIKLDFYSHFFQSINFNCSPSKASQPIRIPFTIFWLYLFRHSFSVSLEGGCSEFYDSGVKPYSEAALSEEIFPSRR